MPKVNKKLLGLLILIILISVAFYSGLLSFNLPGKNQQAQKQGQRMMPTPEVKVIQVNSEEIRLKQKLPGRVNAYQISEIRPQTNGIIESINFEEGSFVKEGTQLYQLDSRSQKATYKQAKAKLKAIKNKTKRFNVLGKVDAVSKQEQDDVLAELAQSQAELDKAEEELGYTRVFAPISGYIGKTNFTKGALVTANQTDPMTTITQLSPIYVDLAQPSEETIKLRNQKNITVTLEMNGKQIAGDGVLEFAEAFADENTDSVTLRSKFSNQEQNLIPGMFVDATLHLKPFSALTIPQRTTTRMPDGSLMVWVISAGNIAQQKIIQATTTYQDKWIINSGLDSGDVIIEEGYMKLKPGTEVKPIMNDNSENISNNSQKNSTNSGSQNSDNNNSKKNNIIIIEKRVFPKKHVSGFGKPENNNTGNKNR